MHLRGGKCASTPLIFLLIKVCDEMDSAVAELISSEHNSNGVLSWFFEILRQPLGEQVLAQCRYRIHLPFIPPTVLFNYSRAQSWYECFLVELASAPAASEGESHPPSAEEAHSARRTTVVEYRKRKLSDLTTHKIVSALCPSYKDIATRLMAKERSSQKTAGRQSDSQKSVFSGIGAVSSSSAQKASADCLPSFSLAAVAEQLPKGRLCAQTIRKSSTALGESASPEAEGRLLGGFEHIGRHVEGPSKAEAAVQFFDEFELGQLLFHDTVDYALLQRFSHPSQPYSQDPSYNRIFVADWQPHYCFVSRSESLMPLGATQFSSQFRGDTSDPRISEYKGAPGWNVQKALCNACNALAERIYFATGGIRIRKMSVVFKLDAAKNRVVMQWCQSACVVTGPSFISARDEIISRLPQSALASASPDNVRTQDHMDADVNRSGVADGAPRLRPVPRHFTYGIGDGMESWHPLQGDVGAHSPLAKKVDTAEEPGTRKRCKTASGRGPSLRVNRQAGEVRRLMDDAFGPLKPLGLLTRTKLDYISYQLNSPNNHSRKHAAVGGDDAMRGVRHSPKASVSGRPQGPPPSLEDILRLGLDEIEKDALFEGLAPRSWSHRRPNRRMPSVHNLLALRDKDLSVGASGQQTSEQNFHVEPSQAKPSLLEVLSGSAARSAAAIRVARGDYVPFVPFSESSPSPQAPHHSESSDQVSVLVPHADKTTCTLPKSERLSLSDRMPAHSSLQGGQLDRRGLAGGNAEVIDPRTWGAPCRVDNVLLLPLDRNEPFSINRIASDAGRLGHREAYLSTARNGRQQM